MTATCSTCNPVFSSKKSNSDFAGKLSGQTSNMDKELQQSMDDHPKELESTVPESNTADEQPGRTSNSENVDMDFTSVESSQVLTASQTTMDVEEEIRLNEGSSSSRPPEESGSPAAGSEPDSPGKSVDTKSEDEMLSLHSPEDKKVPLNPGAEESFDRRADCGSAETSLISQQLVKPPENPTKNERCPVQMPIETKETTESSISLDLSQSVATPKRGLGTPVQDLKRMPTCAPRLPPLKAAHNHTVTIRTDLLLEKRIFVPYPNNLKDVWDEQYVKMPFSAKNLFPVGTEERGVTRRWELIRSSLRRGFKSSLDVQDAILPYNTGQAKKWDFTALHLFFTEYMEPSEAKHYFDFVLPKMVDLALMAPQICTKPIPLLKSRVDHSLTLSQEQIACLLANAFFCTFPKRNSRRTGEYGSLPEINFSRLFEGNTSRKIEKLKTLFCYFKRVTATTPKGLVTFTRQNVFDPPDWFSSQAMLTNLHITCKGTIEDDGHGMLQVDFANRYVGGGVTGNGLVQEEIRFIINPELIISRLFTEALEADECLIIAGAEQYSKYTGYSDGYKWKESYNDKTPRDYWERRCTEIVAIDALKYRNFFEQFFPKNMTRELNKAYCGFFRKNCKTEHLSAIATGNWGCGAFGGDTRLKALIQLMAAAEAGRDVAYFTFGDSQLMHDVHMMHTFLKENRVTVGRLFYILTEYYQKVCKSCHSSKPSVTLYKYICERFDPESDDAMDTAKEPVMSPATSEGH